MKTLFLTFFPLLASSFLHAQAKSEIAPQEIQQLHSLADRMAHDDQVYRNFIAKGTLDPVVAAKIDSVYNEHGIEEGYRYEKALGLSLPKAVEDSLWKLQWELDLQNHLLFQGILARYGWLSEDELGKRHYIQTLLLLHPPAAWKPETYLEEYRKMLLPEVHAGRMSANSYASFVDNIRCKILRKEQLYGTNGAFDPGSGKLLPPMIEDLAKSNAERAKIGLEPLQEGAYRLAE